MLECFNDCYKHYIFWHVFHIKTINEPVQKQTSFTIRTSGIKQYYYAFTGRIKNGLGKTMNILVLLFCGSSGKIESKETGKMFATMRFVIVATVSRYFFQNHVHYDLFWEKNKR